MDLIFFQAALPLTKTIVGTTIAPYPHVSRLTSHTEHVNNLEEMYTMLRKHAALGHCLFNGHLKVPLKHESRAGKTLHGEPREWLVFDFDKVVCDNIEELFPPCMKDISYILQRSASMFVDDSRFSGHVFVMLDRPSNEKELKLWFERLNFDNATLKQQFTLTGSKTALHWPLDRSAAYDSKLIYIAPPRLLEVDPLIKPDEAIKLVKKKKQFLTLPKFEPVARETLNECINRLRREAGLEERRFDTRPFLDGEILIGADKSFISGVKNIGEHYVKFNLGDGDSMGYWMDLRNPRVIKNFKGEPYLLTEEVDQEFFKAIVKQAPKIVAKPPLDDGAEILAFYATTDQASVMTGIWTPTQRNLRLDKSTNTAASAWLAQFGVLKHGHFDHYDLIFDPTELRPQFIPGYPVINTFRATDYMIKERTNSKPSTLRDLPPVTGKVLRSILNDQDGYLLTRFVNWLAYVFQTRKKTETAWVLHGEEGTGKGKFVEFVLKPLFGKSVVRNVQYTLANTDFNKWLDGALFVVFEEATVSAADNQSELMAKLKHWTTEAEIEIHGKGKDAQSKPSFTNFLFFSNMRNPVVLSKSNRRFNIAHRQETPIHFTPNEYMALANGDELEAFADLLQRWPLDMEAVHTVVKTDDAEAMHEQTTPIGQQIADALLGGNVQWFIDRTPSEQEAAGDFGMKFNTLPLYQELMADICTGKKSVVEGSDLYVLFRTLMPDPKYFQEAKLWRNRYYASLGVNQTTHWVNGASVRGVKITWKIPKGFKPAKKSSKTNVIPLRKTP